VLNIIYIYLDLVLFKMIKTAKQIITVYLCKTVAKFVEALRYKPEGRGFDSRWCHWNLSST